MVTLITLVVLLVFSLLAKTGKASVRVIENDFEMRFLAARSVNFWAERNHGQEISLVLCRGVRFLETGMKWES